MTKTFLKQHPLYIYTYRVSQDCLVHFSLFIRFSQIINLQAGSRPSERTRTNNLLQQIALMIHRRRYSFALVRIRSKPDPVSDQQINNRNEIFPFFNRCRRMPLRKCWWLVLKIRDV